MARNEAHTKKGRILAHLQRGASITQQQSIRLYGHYRLASCINRLRNEGYNIETTMRKTITNESYAEYKLVSK